MYTYNAQGSTTNYGDWNPSVVALQQQLNAKGAGLVVDGKLGPKTQAAMQKFGGTTQAPANDLKKALLDDPELGQYNADDLIGAYQTGDWTKFKTASGQPFNSDVANAELDRQMKILDPAFKEDLKKGTADIKDQLGQSQADFENYLATSADQFAEDKSQQDTDAAQHGVLFSSGRVAKLNNLEKQYSQDAAYKRQKLGNQMGLTARDFQYKYGNKPTEGLSSYFNLGGQSYNPFVARNGTSSTGLSTIYRPSQNSYYGTNPRTQKSQAIIGASGVLANKANKLLPYSMNTQF